MVYAPQTQSGNFFNRQERNVHSVQVVEALSISKDHWAGQHVFKFGLDLQHSAFDGDNFSHELDVARLDGSLAEQTTYSPLLTHPSVSGTEFAVFAQDRWRVVDRLTFELGFRADRDDVVQLITTRRASAPSVSVAARGTRDPARRLRQVRGTDAARPSARSRSSTCRRCTRFAADGSPLGAARHLRARYRRRR